MSRLQRYALILIVLGACLNAPPRQAHACSCIAVSPAQAFAHASAVFSGLVISAMGNDAGDVALRLRPDHVWKGDVRLGDEVSVVIRAGGLCGPESDVGADYLVYAAAIEGEAFIALACDGSGPTHAAADYLGYLNARATTRDEALGGTAMAMLVGGLATLCIGAGTGLWLLLRRQQGANTT